MTVDPDPLGSIDAQIRVLTRARAKCRAQILLDELEAVAAMTNPTREQRMRDHAAGTRLVHRDFTVAIDELQSERAEILPSA